MADTLKILGQLQPNAYVSGDLYVAPSAATVSSLVVCNLVTTAATFRVSVALAGVALAMSQYLYFDFVIPGNNTFISTIGITLATTDKIRVQSNSGTLTFSAFGLEVT